MDTSNIKVDITLYWKIRNAAIYGGQGSVGYSSAKFSDCKKALYADAATVVAFCEGQRRITADLLSVSIDDVQLISHAEYDAGTQDESEDWDEEEL